MYGNWFIRDTHQVRSAGPDYLGETIYHWDADNQTIVFRYWNSVGGVSDGAAPVDNGVIYFDGERYVTSEGATIELRSSLERLSPVSYVVVTQLLGSLGWEELHRVEFKRLDTGGLTVPP